MTALTQAEIDALLHDDCSTGNRDGSFDLTNMHDATKLHERINGHPGAGAMGAVIEYRDALRARKSKP